MQKPRKYLEKRRPFCNHDGRSRARPSPLEFPSQQCRCQKRHPLILASVKAVVLVDCSSGGDRVSERNGKKSGRNSTPLYTLTQRFCQILRPENNLLHSDSAGMLDGAQKPTSRRRAMLDALEPTYKCTRPISHEKKSACEEEIYRNLLGPLVWSLATALYFAASRVELIQTVDRRGSC
jgi:hypothetical protein